MREKGKRDLERYRDEGIERERSRLRRRRLALGEGSGEDPRR